MTLTRHPDAVDYIGNEVLYYAKFGKPLLGALKQTLVQSSG